MIDVMPIRKRRKIKVGKRIRKKTGKLEKKKKKNREKNKEIYALDKLGMRSKAYFTCSGPALDKRMDYMTSQRPLLTYFSEHIYIYI